MIKAKDIATVTVDGAPFTAWTEFEVEYNLQHTSVGLLRLSTTEPNAFLGKATQIWPGRKVDLALGGVPVFSGITTVRQAHIAAAQHDLHIVVESHDYPLGVGTLNPNPGEYKNQTIQQITSALAGKVGVAVKVHGGAGAGVPFPMYRETAGQSILSAIETLARCRNYHLCFDPTSALLHLVPLDVPFLGGSGGINLVEGKNFFDGTVTLQKDWGAQLGGAPKIVNVVSQQTGGTPTQVAGPLSANILTPVPNPYWGLWPAVSGKAGDPWSITVVPELPSSPQEAKLRGQHEIDLLGMTQAEALISVEGWFSGNTPWHTMINNPATLKSPSLVPPNFSGGWRLIGVRYRQSNTGGSNTVLILNIKVQGVTQLDGPIG